MFLAAALSACGGGGSSTPTPAEAANDVSVTLSGPGSPVAGGSPVAFTLTVSNAGPDDADGVALSALSVGSGLSAAQTLSCTAAGGAECPDTLSGTPSFDLPAGGSLSFELTSTLAAGSSGSVSSSASVTASDDPAAANNTATATFTAYSADLSVSGVGPTVNVPSGTGAVYTMVVANAGPDAARDVSIVNTLGANQTLSVMSCDADGGATCPAADDVDAEMFVPSIPSGGVLIFTVPAIVTAGTAGTVTNTMIVTADGDPLAANDAGTADATAVSADLSVSNSGPVKVAAGQTATFVGTVANGGPNEAVNLTITHTLNRDLPPSSFTCAAAGGAVCPFTGASMGVLVLPVGGTLTFTIQIPTLDTTRGNVVSTLAVASVGDPTPPAPGVATTVAHDPRNDTYKAYAANGNQYNLTVNFDTSAYTVAGGGTSDSGSFTPDADGSYTMSGNAKFRVAEDLLVGGYAFGDSDIVIPFVAARNFVIDAAELSGSFNIFGRQLESGNVWDSRAQAARWAGGDLQVCHADPEASVDACASGLHTYALAIEDDQFTGTNPDGATIVFRVAKSGSTHIFLRAGSATVFGIGVPGSAGVASGSFDGATTAGAWGTSTITEAGYSSEVTTAGGDTAIDSAALSPVGTVGIESGTRLDGATVYLMQHGPLNVLVTAPDGLPAGSPGYLEIGTP